MKSKRKICFIITSNIHYARSRLILDAIRRRNDLDLQIVIGASALLPKYGNVPALLERDGFRGDFKITMAVEGGDSLAMAKTTGIGIVEFATAFHNLDPDVVVVRGDRYEILSAAAAAAYLNIPVAHIEGGDVSGNIDESVRHAVTKLAHIHFVTNKKSRERVLRMGENPKYVFNFGCPALELLFSETRVVSNKDIFDAGVGYAVDIGKPFVIVMQHPVTSEIGENRRNIEQTLYAVHELCIPAVWFWPNIDAGTDEVSGGIRNFREKHNPEHIYFIKHVSPDVFTGLLKKTACLIGNSSSGIKECSYLGIPVVNIGSRQDGRMRSRNVIDVGYKKEDIKRAIGRQMTHARYAPSAIYFQKDTSKKIANVLATAKLYSQKRFND